MTYKINGLEIEDFKRILAELDEKLDFASMEIRYFNIPNGIRVVRGKDFLARNYRAFNFYNYSVIDEDYFRGILRTEFNIA